MKDLLGMVLVETRDDAGIAAIVGDRVSGEEEGVSDVAPRITIVDMGTTLSPGGAGGSRMGNQGVLYGFRCYGPKTVDAAGEIAARQLAGLVADHFHHPEGWPRMDASGRLIHNSTVQSIGGLLRDPESREPYRTVVVFVVGAAQAVPVMA